MVAKTGMGSSAALTSSLIGSLLHWFGIVNLAKPTSSDLRLVHNLSQLSHSIAQGKIGSGFDVAAAIYGTQFYKRFSADKLGCCLQSDVSSSVIFSSVMQQEIWTQSIDNFGLPPGLDLVMGDVCGGTASTSMVSLSILWSIAFELFNCLSYSIYRQSKFCYGERILAPQVCGMVWQIPMLRLEVCFTT